MTRVGVFGQSVGVVRCLRRVMSSGSLVVLVILGVAALGLGCASRAPARTSETRTATLAATQDQTTDGIARPVRERAPDTGPLRSAIAPSGLVPIDVDPLVVATAPRVAEPIRAPSSVFEARKLTAEVPTAGAPKPGSRGLGFPGATGAGAQAADGLTGDSPEPEGPALLAGFDTNDFDTNNVHEGSFFIPPDSHAAAGTGHLMNVTNVTVRIHEKNGTLKLDTALADFFSSLAPVTALFDPKIRYDHFAGRFVVVALEQREVPPATKESRILLAVSDDSNPEGTWYQTSIPSRLMISGFDRWADYPGFAIDEEAVYITTNMFCFSSSVDPGCTPGFAGVRLWVVSKTQGTGGGFYAGGTPTVYGPSDPYTCADCFATTTQPAHVFGSPPTSPTNVGTFLVSYSGLSEPPATDNLVQIVRIDDPASASPTFTQELVNVGDLGSAIPDAPQPGSTALIATNNRRALDSVWRDSQLYLTATIEPETGPDAGQATAHWWQLDTTTLSNGIDPPETLLTDQGDIGGEDLAPGTHTYFPSVMTNGSGALGFGFSASGPSLFAGAYFATRDPSDPAGTNRGSETVRAGVDHYFRSFSGSTNRWGDYSSISQDPLETDCFWVYNQYADTRGSVTNGSQDGRWGTAYGKFCLRACAALETRTGTLSGSQSITAEQVEFGPSLLLDATADVTVETNILIIQSDTKIVGDLSVYTEACI
ncbi:MAG: hypothetical protein GY769_16400 [bacterium]|nr:hypothetical protein [bacterium]